MGTDSFSGVKSGRGVTLTPHPLLVLLDMKEYWYTFTSPMGRTACTEPQCLYKGALYFYRTFHPEFDIKLTFRESNFLTCYYRDSAAFLF